LAGRDFSVVLGLSDAADALIEIRDPSVTIDLLLRSLILAGTTNAEVGRVIAGAPLKRSAKARAA
jgi:hypothetical protein